MSSTRGRYLVFVAKSFNGHSMISLVVYNQNDESPKPSTTYDLKKIWEEIFTTRDTYEMKKKAANFLTLGLTMWDIGSGMNLFLNYLNGTNYNISFDCGPREGTVVTL